MKIRSHTGNLINARVGMVCDYLGLYIGRISSIVDGEFGYTIALVPTSEFADWDIIITKPEQLTMLSCPFMVGDEYEWKPSESIGDWNADTVMTEREADLMNSGKNGELVRHSNPDLRSKGEV